MLKHNNGTVQLSRQVFQALKQAIVTCAIEPGSRLSENEIAEQYGVSRQPVREAFIKLAETGLIEVSPQRRTYVSKISLKKVDDGRFVREAIEAAIVRRAAASIDDDHLDALAENLRLQARAAAKHDHAGFLELDEAFHAAIAAAIDCDAAWEAIETIKVSMDRVRFLILVKVSPLDRLIAQHTEIYEGLKAHDADRAEQAMRLHLKDLITVFTPAASEKPDWFE